MFEEQKATSDLKESNKVFSPEYLDVKIPIVLRLAIFEILITEGLG